MTRLVAFRIIYPIETASGWATPTIRTDEWRVQVFHFGVHRYFGEVKIMSHPFTEGSNARWAGRSWNGKACYIRAKMDKSVRHPQACGEAIARWNRAVGERFLIVPDKGNLFITFFERDRGE